MSVTGREKPSVPFLAFLSLSFNEVTLSCSENKNTAVTAACSRFSRRCAQAGSGFLLLSQLKPGCGSVVHISAKDVFDFSHFKMLLWELRLEISAIRLPCKINKNDIQIPTMNLLINITLWFHRANLHLLHKFSTLWGEGVGGRRWAYRTERLLHPRSFL